MKKNTTKNMVLSGLFIALGLVLPQLFAHISGFGSRFLPMHIPVLLCGFVCGWPYGLFVGFVTPLLSGIIFGMPPIFPVAAVMAFELAAYGFATGLLYRLFEKKNVFVYAALIISMICGRIVWGIVSYAVYVGIRGSAFTWADFIAGAFVNAVPGIILQIVIIPVIVMALKRSNMIYND